MTREEEQAHFDAKVAKRKAWIVEEDRPHWVYPDQEKPPSGKVLLLTIGNVCVLGTWTNDGRYKAWQHLLKRNKAHEARLGYV